MVTYTTIQGDTWDGIAYKLYGDEGYMKDLIEANLDHADTLVFSSGTELACPGVVYETDNGVPFWREDDASETEDDTEDDDDYEE